MKKWRCRLKQNFGWARTEKPSRPTLKILQATPNNKTSFTVKKYYRPTFVKKKKKHLLNVGRKTAVGGYLTTDVGYCFFSFQSLNNIWMTSIRKCSIGVIRWCFFSKPRSVIFPGRRRLEFFSISTVNHVFLPRLANVFLLPGKWKHAGVGRNATSVELDRKNLAGLHRKFLRQHRTKKHPLSWKNIVGQRL